MAEITTLFWDVGGVLLTNGWDRVSRRRAAEQFGLDWEDLQDRHELVADAFETGRMTLEHYLRETIFYRPRPFTRDEFTAFMFAQSQPRLEALAVLEQVARPSRYLLATLNNEPLELNLYRIERFGLRSYFTVFFSSCFLGVRKPDEAIYRLALNLTQCGSEACLFIDDRALNTECAQRCGIQTIHYHSPAQLRRELRARGITEVQPDELQEHPSGT